MTPAQNPKIQQIALVDIIVGKDRLRPVSQAGVDSLVASINEIGVIKDAIHLRKKRGHGLWLMAGGHRLAAAKQLGWDTIPARVWADVSDDFAKLMEVHDNLAGAELSALELSVFLAEGKAVYERAHPETKAGFAGASAKHGFANDIMSFAKSVAEKRDISSRHVERLIGVGEALTADDISILSMSENPIKLTDLMSIAKIEAGVDRSKVITRLSSGNFRNFAAAHADALPNAKPKKSKTDAAHQKILELWHRTPKAAKRLFVEDIADDLREFLEGDA